jgi:hypothetical protein
MFISISHFFFQIMTTIDSLSAEHMRSEQSFLQQTLKSSQSSMDKQTTSLQSHLTKTLEDVQEIGSAMQRQRKSVDSMVTQFKQHVSEDNALTSAFKEFLNGMMSAAGKKRTEIRTLYTTDDDGLTTTSNIFLFSFCFLIQGDPTV